MGEVVNLNRTNKTPPSPVPRVCATCEFFVDKSYYSMCKAQGNVYTDSHRGWEACLGTFWQKEKGIWTKIKDFFS